jgi:hypothetical protein
VKHEVLRSDASRLETWARGVVDSEDPQQALAG